MVHETHLHLVIQAVPFSSPIVGGLTYITPSKGSRELTIPKRSRCLNHQGVFSFSKTVGFIYTLEVQLQPLFFKVGSRVSPIILVGVYQIIIFQKEVYPFSMVAGRLPGYIPEKNKVSPRTQKTNQTHHLGHFNAASGPFCCAFNKVKGMADQTRVASHCLLAAYASTAFIDHTKARNTSSQALAPDKNIPAAFYTKALLHRPLHPVHNLFLPQPEKPKVEPLLFSKNWQLYFSLVYLFWASLQRNLFTS